MKKTKQLCLLSAGLLLLFSCTGRQENVDAIPVSFSRLETKLFDRNLKQADVLPALRQQYGSFADLYFKEILGLRAENDSALTAEIEKYRTDKYILEVNKAVADAFKDISWLEKDLQNAFSRFNHHFPRLVVPRIVTYTAPFSYNAVASDSVLGIGLDMYLGADYNYYLSAGFPLYKIRKLSKEYIVADAVKAWVQSDYEEQFASNDLLNNMIYEGKLLYCLDRLLPEMEDTLKYGYSESEWEWCEDNEENIWKFFIEQKLLFNKNPGDFIKYINDGAGTGGFPDEAPARLGVYIGLRIVQSYVGKNNPSLPDLMALNDGNKLLIESGFKPRKN